MSAEGNGARGAKVLEEKKGKTGPSWLPGRLSGCLLATLCRSRSDGRRGSGPPSLTPRSPHEAATVASGAENPRRPQPQS